MTPFESGYGVCPKCREHKFVGHGPLCYDSYDEACRDQGVPMIFRKPPRIVAQACIGCHLLLNACQANRDINRASCCDHCRHE